MARGGLRGLFGNRHVVAAMLVAPILAVMAYFAVDYWVGEAPQAARAGNSYPLVARPNCRWASGRCTLTNADLTLRIEPDGGGLALAANVDLDGVEYAVGESGGTFPQPQLMERVDARSFRLVLPAGAAEYLAGLELRLVASTGGVTFYAATAMGFLTPPQP